MTSSDSSNTSISFAAPDQSLPSFFLPRESVKQALRNYSYDLHAHRRLLSNVTPDFQKATPLFYISLLPTIAPTPGTSSAGLGAAAEQRYQEIERQLSELEGQEVGADPPVEIGAVETARAVVQQLRKQELAPPELSWFGGEAVVMLWALGSTRYALTVTDGELGYVVRRPGNTIRRRSKIKPEEFDVVRLK